MEYPDWEPFYSKILGDFGFSRREDETVARELDRLLGGTRTTDRDLRGSSKGRR